MPSEYAQPMRFPVLLVALFSLACGLFPSVPRPEPSPAVALPADAPSPPTDPSAAAVNEGVNAMMAEGNGAVTPPVLSPEAGRAALVDAFLAQCDFEPQVLVDGPDGPLNAAACQSLDFDQNCSPDFSGCWSANEDCKYECGNPCAACSGGCAASCDACKADCAGKVNGAECLRACAESRTTCHETCLSNRIKCIDVDCSAAETACSAKYDARVVAECGDACQTYRDCPSRTEPPTAVEVCEAEAGKLSEFCRNACSPYD